MCLHKFIVWVLLTIIYIIYHFIFQTSYSKLTLRCHFNNRHPSHKWQREITVCFFRCIATQIRLLCYIVLINLFYFINFFLEHHFLLIRCYHSKDGQFIFLFWIKTCSYNSTDLIISKNMKSLFESNLPFIYIIYHFIFQTGNSKPTLRWHCNSRHQRCVWRIDSYKG